MGGSRKIWGDLRDVIRDGVDDIEKTGAHHLDRLAERGVQGLEEFRAEVAGASRGESRSRRTSNDSDRHMGCSAKADRQASRAGRKARRGGRTAGGYVDRVRSRKRRSRRRGEEADLTPEEREHRAMMRRARRRANQRIGFMTHFGVFVAALSLILVTTRNPRVVLIVALGWGIGLFSHYLWAMAAPRLRDRWVESEVGSRSERDVKKERRHVETRSRRSMEDLSASIAHEIRNPITAAKSLVQQMGEDPASNENLEYAGLALSELDRVERSISHLLRYARDEEPRFSPMSLRDVVMAAAEGLRDRARALGVDLRVEFDSEGAMRGDTEKLRRVVENLISNALDAVSEAGTPMAQIELLGGDNLAGTETWLRVIDNGPGIPIVERDRIWSPFFTTKESGTGLGLALSRKAIEAHGGRIDLLSSPGQGTEFVLTFPKDATAPEVTGDNDVLG